MGRRLQGVFGALVLIGWLGLLVLLVHPSNAMVAALLPKPVVQEVPELDDDVELVASALVAGPVVTSSRRARISAEPPIEHLRWPIPEERRAILAATLVQPDGTNFIGDFEMLQETHRPADDWPAKPTIFCAPCERDPRDEPRVAIEYPFLKAHRASDAWQAGPDFQVEVEREYWVGVFGGAFKTQRQKAVISKGQERLPIRLQAEIDLAPRGALVFDCESGVKGFRREDLHVTIHDRASGLPMVFRYGVLGGRGPGQLRMSPTKFALPVGDYRLTVEAQHHRNRCSLGASGTRKLGRFESEIAILPEQANQLTATLTKGARLLLSLEGGIQWVNTSKAPSPVQDIENPERDLELASLVLIPEDGLPIPVERFRPFPPFGEGLSGFWAMGRQQLSDPLPVGRFRLEGHLVGGRIASVEVLLGDGQVTQATLNF